MFRQLHGFPLILNKQTSFTIKDLVSHNLLISGVIQHILNSCQYIHIAPQTHPYAHPHTPWSACPAPRAMLQTFGPGPGLPYHCLPQQHGPARHLKTAPSEKQAHTIMLHAIISLGNEIPQH